MRALPALLCSALALAACGSPAAPDGANPAQPGSSEATASIAVGQPQPPTRAGATPISVAVTDDDVWVLDQSTGRLGRFDAATGRRESPGVKVARSGLEVVAGEGALWVLDGAAGVRRVDAESGRPQGRAVPVPDPAGIAAGAGGVWVSSRTGATVTRIDPDTLRAGEPIAVDAGATGLAVAGDGVWVAESEAGSVARIDANGLEVTERQEIAAGQVLAIASDGESVYAAAATTEVNGELEVIALDPVTGAPRGAATPLPGGIPLRLAAGTSGVWATDVGTSLPGSDPRPAGVMRVDPQTGSVDLVARVAGAPSAIALSESAVWVTDSARGSLTRIPIG